MLYQCTNHTSRDFFFKDDFKNLPEGFCVGIDTANGATYELADRIYTMLEILHKIINNTPKN